MAGTRLLMRRLRDLLRLKYAHGLTHRAIAQACGVGLGTVCNYLDRAGLAGLTWPLPDDLDDAALEARLFVRPETPPAAQRPPPDVVKIHTELARQGVTLQLLWLEYRGVHPGGYSYSQYCDHYRRFARRLRPSMRQVHRAGEKLFVDFAGKRPHLVDQHTGEVVPVELFVGSVGASGLIYAEATRTQDLAAWVGAHVRLLEACGGSPALWIPDNLKSAVTLAHRYEPEVNRTYADLARHYGAVVIPTRVRRPRDKPRVEVSVQIAERWIVAVLRDRVFFELADLNAAITEEVARLNDRPMRALGVSRRARFDALDRPALRPLPLTRFEVAEWVRCRVNIDYHVAVDHNTYSVPYPLVHAEVEARVTTTTVEVFYQQGRIASHLRAIGRGHAVTCAAHMPPTHRAYATWTPERLMAWAAQSGPATARLVAGILERRAHPELGYRSVLGLLRLGQQHGASRLEAGCARAERLGAYSYRTVANILRHALDRLPLDDEDAPVPSCGVHDHLRGAGYYAQKDTQC
jgi:transposase